eukprot:g32290.t1
MTKEMEIKIKTKKCPYDRYQVENIIENQEEYQKFRGEVKKQLREVMRNYEKRLAANIKECPKVFCRMNQEIHSLLKSRSEAFKSDDPDLHRKSRYCMNQLAGTFADIFNLSLIQCEVITYFKKTTIRFWRRSVAQVVGVE